jgi:hypothetical protein
MNKTTNKQYETKNPVKARIIKKAVKRGIKQYAETFRRLAAT